MHIKYRAEWEEKIMIILEMLLWNDNKVQKWKSRNWKFGMFLMQCWPPHPLILPILVHQYELTIKRVGDLKALQTLRAHHVSVSIKF